jgi:hypothetical protein
MRVTVAWIFLAVACVGLAQAGEGSGSLVSSGNPSNPSSGNTYMVASGGGLLLPPTDDDNNNGNRKRWTRRSSHRYTTNPIAGTKSQASSTPTPAASNPDSSLPWGGILIAISGLGSAIVAAVMLRRWRRTRSDRRPMIGRNGEWGHRPQPRSSASLALAAKLVQVQQTTSKFQNIAEPETRTTRRAA